MGKVFLVLLACAFSTNVFGGPLTLETLKQQLKRSGANWVAGETHVSQLPAEERSKMLGAILPEGFDEPFVSQEKSRNRHPASFDWRNVDGVSYTAPILNQGSCGSCVAFAAVTTLETQLNITRKTPFSPWAYSPQHLFACGGGGCKSGWQPASAAAFLKTKGIPDEACYPYVSGATGKDASCSSTCGDAAARSEKIVSSSQPTFFFVNQDAIKAALQKGPLMTVMMVYEDFLFYKGGVYKHVTGNVAGGHAITIVGWNDADRAWIVKNSWGEGWGENGYFRIAYSDTSNLGSQTWKFEVSDANGYVTLGSLRDYAVLKGTVGIDIKSTYPNTQSLNWTLDKDRATVDVGKADVFNRAYFDTTKHQDGTYTIQAVATHVDGQSMSQPRKVHILNGAFTGAVRLKNITAGQTITGQTELDVETEAAPVPFTKLIFTAKNVATGEETKRMTENPVSKMTMLWRAQLLPNGEYDLSLEGKVGDVAKVTMPTIRVTVQH